MSRRRRRFLIQENSIWVIYKNIMMARRLHRARPGGATTGQLEKRHHPVPRLHRARPGGATTGPLEKATSPSPSPPPGSPRWCDDWPARIDQTKKLATTHARPHLHCRQHSPRVPTPLVRCDFLDSTRACAEFMVPCPSGGHGTRRRSHLGASVHEGQCQSIPRQHQAARCTRPLSAFNQSETSTAHLKCSALPKAFRRNYSIHSVGSANQETIEEERCHANRPSSNGRPTRRCHACAVSVCRR